MTTPSAHGCITVVAYVPEPLASAIRHLRSNLPGGSDPHVTLLPPRPLNQPAGDAVTAMTNVLASHASFPIELCRVCRFVETDVLYLSVGQGNQQIRLLHDELARQAPGFSEPFEFRPHLTLGGPVPAQDMARRLSTLSAQWEQLSSDRRFWVEEVKFLWLASGAQKSDWKHRHAQSLKPSGMTFGPDQQILGVEPTSQTS